MRAIAFCKAHGLLLIHDAPYVDQVSQQGSQFRGPLLSDIDVPTMREV